MNSYVRKLRLEENVSFVEIYLLTVDFGFKL